MKKQYIYTLAIILLGCLKINAQEVETKNKALKLYSNFHILNTPEASRFILPDPSGFHFHNVSIAFSKNRKKPNRYYEVEFSLLTRKKEGDKLLTESTIDTIVTPPRIIFTEKNVPISTEDLVFRLRFELGRWVKMFKDEKLKLGWSPSIEANVHSSKENPKSVDSFASTGFNASLKLAVVPRVQYDLTSKLFLDLNFPIQLISFGVDYMTIENPILTERQKTQGGFDFDLTGEILLRLGVGYRF